MNVQDVVKLAKHYLSDVFQEESPSQIGLEEIEFDAENDEWDVTIGFNRPSVTSGLVASALGPFGAQTRSYKIVRIRNDDGRMVAIKQRTGLD